MSTTPARHFATTKGGGPQPATPSGRRHLAIWLALAVLCAQLLFAWHSPAHILTPEHDSETELLAAADCHVCTHGHGLLALPSLYDTPVSPHSEPAPLYPTLPPLGHTRGIGPLPRGPPASV
ncbi:MAG: hypothetical protein VX258_13085 [Pseudomonadota bacterium]|nr:hypothetical protein [Pseudomonadota bacterium]